MNSPGIRPDCERLLNELEVLNIEGVTEADVLSALMGTSRQNALQCEDCRSAVEYVVTAAGALAAMKVILPEPGPWFTAGVMAAVKSAENEIEESKEGVWISVR